MNKEMTMEEIESQSKRSAIVYTGQIPEETAVVLWATCSTPNTA
jgi:hypothetical protein